MARGLPGAVAVGFLVYGIGFIAATIWPMSLGDANWEVAAFGEAAQFGAVPLIGAALLGGWGAAEGRRVAVLASAVICAVAVGLYGLGVVVLALDVPLVRAVTAGTGASGMLLRVLVAKAGLLSALYTVVFLSLVVIFSRSFFALRRS